MSVLFSLIDAVIYPLATVFYNLSECVPTPEVKVWVVLRQQTIIIHLANKGGLVSACLSVCLSVCFPYNLTFMSATDQRDIEKEPTRLVPRPAPFLQTNSPSTGSATVNTVRRVGTHFSRHQNVGVRPRIRIQ